MKDQLITLETAILAKAKGFDVGTTYYLDEWNDLGSANDKPNWNKSKSPLYSAPTQSLLARWLRETHHLHVALAFNPHYCYQVRLEDLGYPEDLPRFLDNKWLAHDYGTYEDALEAGLAHALSQL